MTDNFIADGAGAGGARGEPLKLLLNAGAEEEDQEVHRRHGPAGLHLHSAGLRHAGRDDGDDAEVAHRGG